MKTECQILARFLKYAFFGTNQLYLADRSYSQSSCTKKEDPTDQLSLKTHAHRSGDKRHYAGNAREVNERCDAINYFAIKVQQFHLKLLPLLIKTPFKLNRELSTQLTIGIRIIGLGLVG